MTKKEFKVTPYEAEGEIDYDKLIREFGVSKIDDKLLNRLKKHTKDLHLFLRRKVFYSFSDLFYSTGLERRRLLSSHLHFCSIQLSQAV